MSPSFNKDSLLFRHRQLAPNASVRVSPICLGSMTFGESHADRYGECSKDEAFAILDHFYSEGGNFIDTANMYRDGESEQWLGEWMSSRKNRDDIVLATKYTSGYMSHKPEHLQSNYIGNGSKSMKLSLENSLKNLQTTYIDLFYVHWWDSTTTIPELMHSLNDLVVAGKVLYLGISDTPAWVVSMANEYARNNGLRPFSVYQGMWNAGMRDFERDIIPMARQQGMALCPYGVLGQGRFQTEEAFKEREKGHSGRKHIPLGDHDRHVSKILEDIAKAKGCELLQVAFAYVQQKVPYVFPLVGQRKVSHLKGSIGALSVSLTEEEIEKVESAYKFDHGFPHTFLSGTLFDPDAKPKQVDGPGDVALTKGQSGMTYDWQEDGKAIRPPQ
ncbi:Aldo/keto reductase [Dothidotthia symphoricarpi CBS 119687]|uniref:Aldo/keto reductase n=1 Tax=Dothidotthia symphoricarpi CBS 119687 TaxID=1392245 RepID=A0A6A5ZVI0_9PLEO|nr:Aldo/keto reductase [Dothidotthia symphoricarpi CBS 119687]KAF2123529.1 Aldo/keto reductase [Dothidotthia symphoricarpi CBS 119687]